MKIKLKRVYEAPSETDGTRILVERLWPRGLTKAAAAVDHWAKEIAPSSDLRKWYGHNPTKWPEFQKKYRIELKANEEQLKRLKGLCAEGAVTFVYAAKDEERNSAVLLAAFLQKS